MSDVNFNTLVVFQIVLIFALRAFRGVNIAVSVTVFNLMRRFALVRKMETVAVVSTEYALTWLIGTVLFTLGYIVAFQALSFINIVLIGTNLTSVLINKLNAVVDISKNTKTILQKVIIFALLTFQQILWCLFIEGLMDGAVFKSDQTRKSIRRKYPIFFALCAYLFFL